MLILKVAGAVIGIGAMLLWGMWGMSADLAQDARMTCLPQYKEWTTWDEFRQTALLLARCWGLPCCSD
jgi:hypothetical protein